MILNNLPADEGAPSNGEQLPLVSVLIPCRNEAKYIVGCLESVVRGDYPAECTEIWVIDGISEDGTPQLVRDYSRDKPHIRLLSNPGRVTPTALNMGVSASRGAIIARVDAHARVAPDYLRQCVTALHRFSADNVGGPMHTLPSTNTAVGRAIVLSLSQPFGVGNSVFRTHRPEACEVDTVFGGCFPKAVFERVGLYNEKLARGQDMEFNLRLRRAGGRIMFVPEIVSHYYARATYRAFARHNFVNGVWALLPFSLSEIVPVRPRHLVPLGFVLVLLILLLLSYILPAAGVVLAVAVAAYALACLAAAVSAGWARRDPPAAAYLPLMFATLHFCYGAGSLVGAVQLLLQRRFWRRLIGSQRKQRSVEQRSGGEPVAR